MEGQSLDGRTMQIIGAVMFAVGSLLAGVGTTSIVLLIIYCAVAIGGAVVMNNGRKRREEERRANKRPPGPRMNPPTTNQWGHLKPSHRGQVRLTK